MFSKAFLKLLFLDLVSVVAGTATGSIVTNRTNDSSDNALYIGIGAGVGFALALTVAQLTYQRVRYGDFGIFRKASTSADLEKAALDPAETPLLG